MYSFNPDLNTSPKLSPTSSESSLGGLGGSSSITNAANGMTMDVVELQKENARLRKEIEAKETKLNSSMRSIKMFWSPELKKERAARKAEEEKYARLREQFSVVSEESQQRTETIRDLQEQLRQQREEQLSGGLSSPVSSSLSLHSQDGLQREVERLRVEKDRQENETFILQKSLEDLSSRLEVQQQAIQAKDETIAQLMEMVQSNKGLESKQLEMHKEQHNSDKRKLAEVLSQLTKLREGIEERDRAICSLQEEIDNARIHNVNDELQQSANLLAKDSHIAELETQISQLEGEVENLKKTASEDEKKRQEEKKQTEVFESHSKFMKAKIESLKVDLGKKEAALAATETKLQTVQAHQSNQQEHISVLQTSLSTKEHHIKNLQTELESLRGRLDEREEIIKQKEKRLVSISSEHSENSYAVENLQSVLNTKERQITSLKHRCECLEKDLHEKDVTLSNMKTQLSSIKSEHDSSSSTISSLEARIRDKDRHIEMLQNQRQRSGVENEEEVNRVKKAHEKLEARLSSLKGQLADKEEDLAGLERQISSLKSTVQEKTVRLASAEETIKRLEDQLDEAGSKKDHASTELSNKRSEISRLEKEVRKHQNEVKSKDKEIKRLEEEVKEQQDKVQQLNEACQVKDNKIDDLEKQLKEQSKRLAGVKRNQQIEREKHAQLLNEVKKQGDQEDERMEHYQIELQQKESRIAVLEEALTESVSIAAEREELLAQQAQDAKTATSRVEDMESEVERMRIETAVTNTKNASLVLALNENDIILSFYKSERHRMVEELLEMRQNALLATISEKDANMALLELSPTVGSDMEVRKFKAEKDKLVNELKEQTQKRMTLLSNEEDKEISLSSELAQAPKEKILEAVSLIEDSMEKLQQYGEELIEICQKHFPDVLKKLPKLQRRQMSNSEQLKNSSQKQLLDKLESLEGDMQLLQENIHKLLELIEDFSDT